MRLFGLYNDWLGYFADRGRVLFELSVHVSVQFKSQLLQLPFITADKAAFQSANNSTDAAAIDTTQWTTQRNADVATNVEA